MWSRRNVIVGALSALLVSISEHVRAAWQIFQVSTSALPAGVVLQQIDGGPTYYATNGFTKATAYPVSVAYQAGTVTYTNGWDDPQFFAIGISTPPFDTGGADVSRWMNLGLNTSLSVYAPSLGLLNAFQTAHISVIWPYYYGGSISTNDRDPGIECVSVFTLDEPDLFGSVESALDIPLLGQGVVTMTNCTYPGASGAGYVDVSGTVTGGAVFMAFNETYQKPTWTGSGVPAGAWAVRPSSGYGGTGSYTVTSAWQAAAPSFSGITCTQAATNPLPNSIIGGRFISGVLSAAATFNNPVIHTKTGTISTQTYLSNTYLCQDGRNRHIDAWGTDLFCHVSAWYNPGQVTNIYDPTFSTPAWSNSEVAKGSRYGDMIDFARKLCTVNSVPLWNFIDNSNSQSGSGYNTQPCETHWAIWSSIIHGARIIYYFNSVDANAYGGCLGNQGADVTQCAFMQSAQTCTLSGTISGSTLTVASDPSSGTLSKGMRATSGVSGTCIILQQTNNFTTPGKGTGTTYTFTGTAGAQSGTMTFKQSQVGFGLSVVSMGGINAVGADCAMTDGMKVINDTVRALAPVINSPFAVAAVGGGGKCYVDLSTVGLSYIFPSDTGVVNTTPPKTVAFGLTTGIECCTKYYTGPTYSYGSDTISKGFYIFAATRQHTSDGPTTVTFKLNDPNATLATVIGEARTKPISGGQFTDTFDYAWTVHVYKIT
jgi:hypothetical protein